VLTARDMAKMYRDRFGIDIPHPRPETTHIAEDLGVALPCNGSLCSFDYECALCDQLMQLKLVDDPASLPEYLVSEYSVVRDVARTRLDELHP